MKSILIYIAVIVLICLGSIDASAQRTVFVEKKRLECEKRAHSSFSPAQRVKLCEHPDGEYSLGPAACSVAAKDTLHLKFDDILSLCKEAVSSSPVDCLSIVEAKHRNTVGISLCKQATSTLPADCFQEMSKLFKPSQKAAADPAVALFCSGMVDLAPILCVKASQNNMTTSYPLSKAMDVCKDAVGSALDHPLNSLVANCIAHLGSKHTHQLMPSLHADDILAFCVEINPHLHSPDDTYDDTTEAAMIPAVDCIFHLHSALKTQTHAHSSSITVKQMLSICRQASVSRGPVNCTLAVLSASIPSAALKPDDIAHLCQGATNAGPAACFVDSGKGAMGINHEERTRLCNAATSAAPSLCYRRAAPAFRKDGSSKEQQLELCVGAVSEGPAECAVAAPHYLIADEKVHLCTAAPVSSYNSPNRCLQAVHSHSRNFHDAPKRALGYFQENLQLDSEWTSRALLVSLCSFSDSQDPIAAAECYRSVPTSLQHDHAVRLCTNISSVNAIPHVQLCHRILPKSWSSASIAILCEGLVSRPEAEAAVKCAVDMLPLSASSLRGLSSEDIATLCTTESSHGAVLTCVKKIASSLTAAQIEMMLTNDTMVTLCSNAGDMKHKPGDCLARMASMTSTSVSFAPQTIPHLCREADYEAILTCLPHHPKRLVGIADIDRCRQEERVITSVRVKRIQSIDDNDIKVTAGRRFSLWFEVLDQWNQRYFPSPTNSGSGRMIKISINENNANDAVLWGIRSNSTGKDGLLFYHSLIVSMAGQVEVKLTLLPSLERIGSSSSSNVAKVIGSFQLLVHEDPIAQQIAPCLHLFNQGQCPAGIPAWVAESAFPMVRSRSPPSQYMANLLCYYHQENDGGLQHWDIKARLIHDGSLHVEYRLGIDSIWSGIGLPRPEMSPAERLGLFLSAADHDSSSSGDSNNSSSSNKKSLAKRVKRAYYRSSLQWHPDRWAGYEQYQHVVQGIFHLITEAHDQLQKTLLLTVDE